MTLRFSVQTRNDRANAINTAAATGILRIYSGSQPASVATAASGTLLAELTCSATFGTVSNGVLTANAIANDTSANATGTAGWCRLFASNGTTAILDGAVGTELTLNNTSIASGQPVSITSFVITEGNS